MTFFSMKFLFFFEGCEIRQFCTAWVDVMFNLCHGKTPVGLRTENHSSHCIQNIKMSKRKLGLGKVRAKKQKLDLEEKKDNGATGNAEKPGDGEGGEGGSNTNEELLTVELANEVNPDDPLSQLCGLWKTWKDGERNNELILNGIINECDRILRNTVENGGTEAVTLNDHFYSIYGQAMCDLSKFKPDVEVKAWIDNSLERIDEGCDRYGADNIRLMFARSYILLNRIAIQYIAQMNVDSKKEEFPGLKKAFDEFIDTWNAAVAESEKQKDSSLFREAWVLEILNIFDDLLDIVDKFGTQMSEVVDSDSDSDNDADAGEAREPAAADALHTAEFEISEDHPLHAIQNDDAYNVFWRDSMLKFRDLMDADADADAKLRRSVHDKLGQSFLMQAEEPIAFYNSFQYDTDDTAHAAHDADDATAHAAAAARAAAEDLVSHAVHHLRQTHDDHDPKTWVNLAEALITYGNLLDLDGPDQNAAYAEAERLLRRANNACHGRYQDILDSLVPQP